MRQTAVIFAAIAVVVLLSGSAMADFTVYNASGSDWTAVNTGAGTATWVLPASIPGCGSENETSCEPAGVFYVNTGGAWSGIPSYIALTSPDGSLSDVIAFDSQGPNGWLRIVFTSDPSIATQFLSYFQFGTFVEDGGASGPFTICCEAFPLSVLLASDLEASFDPFGAGFDTSDGIQFQGAVNGGNVPEPGTLVLFGSGLIAAAGTIRRKLGV